MGALAKWLVPSICQREVKGLTLGKCVMCHGLRVLEKENEWAL